MTSTYFRSSTIKSRSAGRQIKSFRQRFGSGHFYLACHAAMPLTLTPDLLYSLWANFQRDIQGNMVEIPWIAVADLMLSNLCKEVGRELYEMDVVVRDELLYQLQQDSRFGLERVLELANFVMAYVENQLDSPDEDVKDLAQAQHWGALAYKNPSEAARSIATVLGQLSFDNKAEWIRMVALLNYVEQPLSAFQPLLNYTRAMADLARGNLEAALTRMSKAVDNNNQMRVEGIDLPIPDVINGGLPKSTKQDQTGKTGIPGFVVFDFAANGYSHPVYCKGNGPAVILMHEESGMTPECVDLARRIANAGFTVYMPLLFGKPDELISIPRILAYITQLYISQEVYCLAKDRSSPITDWLQALCRKAHAECSGTGVGVIGMGLTGGFVLSLIADESVIAPVIAQPSLPFSVTAANKAALGVSPQDLEVAKKRANQGVPILALRFSEDNVSPPERFETLRQYFGGTPHVIQDNSELCQRRGNILETIEINSKLGNPYGIPENSHSTLTLDYRGGDHPTNRVVHRVLNFLKEQLLPKDETLAS